MLTPAAVDLLSQPLVCKGSGHDHLINVIKVQWIFPVNVIPQRSLKTNKPVFPQRRAASCQGGWRVIWAGKQVKGRQDFMW